MIDQLKAINDHINDALDSIRSMDMESTLTSINSASWLIEDAISTLPSTLDPDTGE